MLKYFWPPILDIDDARKVARQGSVAAAFCSIATAVITYFSTGGRELIPGWSVTAYVDAAVFAVISFGIYRMSRIAAFIGFGVYVWGRIDLYMTMGPESMRNPWLVILFILYFMHSVRATMAYHELRAIELKHEAMDAAQASVSEAQQAAGQASPPLLRLRFFVLAAVILGIMAVTAAAAYIIPKAQQSTAGRPKAADALAVEQTPGKAPAEQPGREPLPGEKTFRLKSGETVKGKVIYEDDVYYNVESWNGTQTTVIKEDLSRPPE